LLLKTYEKVNALFEEAGGYLSTKELLANKITTIQIRTFLQEGRIEKVSHGHYWNLMSKSEKPENYKMMEACMTNKRAVICALSACYYHGIIKEEPELLYVATQRTDRGGMKLTFPVSRHYFSVTSFEQDMLRIPTKSGEIKVYGVDRSVCDCIRLEKEIGEKALSDVLKGYAAYKEKNVDRLLEYADQMRYGKIVRGYLEDL
jgi:predicted transcriptional regulator of viral defense system